MLIKANNFWGIQMEGMIVVLILVIVLLIKSFSYFSKRNSPSEKDQEDDR